MLKYKTHLTCKITLHVVQIVNTKATQYTLKTWFVSGI
jgi:hypothetical protein